MRVPTLKSLCQNLIIDIMEKHNYHPRLINDICKRVPHPLLERVFQTLLERNVITDVALLAFLIPDRTQLNMSKAIQIKKATFKQISYNCPHLQYLDLSDCVQVSNSVVRCILQGCSSLSDLRLDRCRRITDAAFDSNQSLFNPLVGCLSLEAISLQGCPQLTGSVAVTLNKMCMRLKYLNLSQCKRIESPAIQQIFEHHHIISLNLSFIDGVSDDAFLLFQLPPSVSSMSTFLPESSLSSFSCPSKVVTPLQFKYSPLQKLYLGNSTITDHSMYRMKFLSQLTEIGLQWCSGITDKGIIALTLQCPKLQFIDLKSCQIGDVAINAIARNCVYLTRLDVSGCMNVTDQGFESLVQSMMRKRKRTDSNTASSDNITATGGTDGSDISSSNNVSIENGDVGNTNDDDNLSNEAETFTSMETVNEINNDNNNSMNTNTTTESVIHDADHKLRMKAQNGLKTLCIVWCSQLTDMTLTALQKLSSLEEIDVSGCTGLTASSVHELRASGVCVKMNSVAKNNNSSMNIANDNAIDENDDNMPHTNDEMNGGMNINDNNNEEDES